MLFTLASCPSLSNVHMTTECPTIDDFGAEVGLSGPEVDNLSLTLVSVEQGDVGILHSLGIKVHTVSTLFRAQ